MKPTYDLKARVEELEQKLEEATAELNLYHRIAEENYAAARIYHMAATQALRELDDLP